MSTTTSYHTESHRPGHFSEKIENFFRTTENVYQASKPSATTSNLRGVPIPESLFSKDIPTFSFANATPSSFTISPSRLQSMGLIRDRYELYVELSPCYKPECVSVSTQDELIIIAGKYEEQHPEFGYQSKEFTHKYTLPKNIDKSKMTCIFKERGYLKIEAPFIRAEDANSHQIPIRVLTETTSAPSSNSSPLPPHSSSPQQQPVRESPQPQPTVKSPSASSIGTSVSHV